ncbi:MAG TPA: translation elongation factor Ts [Erysipelothrix sp.]|nr:translation elongation factor Ts [Erysipelothrix sp.]
MAAITAKLVKELRDRTGAGMLDCKKALEATGGNVEEAITWLREKGIASAQKKEGRIAAEGLTNIVIGDNKAVIVELNSETDFVAKNEQFLSLVETVSNAILNNNPQTNEDVLALEVDGTTISDLVINATSTIGEKITFRRFEVLNKDDNQVFGSYKHMGGSISAIVVVEGDNEEIAKDMAMQIASMNPTYVSMKDIPQEIMEKEQEIQVNIVKNDPELSSKPEKVIEGIIRGRVSKSMQEVSLMDQIFFKDGSSKVAQVLKEANTNVVSFVRFAVGEGIEKREENFAEEVAKASQV